MATTVNNYSEKLQELLKEHALQPGETAVFRLLQGPVNVDAKNSDDQRVTLERRKRNFRLPPSSTIIDPGTGKPLAIGYVVGEAPSTIPGVGLEPKYGQVWFTDENSGQILVTSDNPTLLEYLLLTDWNPDSINPSKRRPANGYRYERVKPDQEAKKKNDVKFARGRALRAVEELGGDELADVCGKLNLPLVDGARPLTEDELRGQLADLADTEPLRVEGVLEAGERKLEQLVADAVALDILVFVPEANEWRWKASQNFITAATIGHAPEAALVGYLQNGGDEAVKFSQSLSMRVGAEKKKRK